MGVIDDRTTQAAGRDCPWLIACRLRYGDEVLSVGFLGKRVATITQRLSGGTETGNTKLRQRNRHTGQSFACLVSPRLRLIDIHVPGDRVEASRTE